MNITRKICQFRYQPCRINLRKFRLSVTNFDSSAQPQVSEKFDFEDLKVIERTERRKPQIPPFMKDVFVSIFNRDLLAYPEILNKEESEALEDRLSKLEKVFADPKNTRDERINVLKYTGMYGAPVNITNGGLAMNCTESLRYLDVISSDLQLAQDISNHWVCLNVLRHGLSPDGFRNIVSDLISGDFTISLCIKEKISERLLQADFKTTAQQNIKGIWSITGEKICSSKSDYLVVLCVVDDHRYKVFLVHPGAKGIKFGDNLVSFADTPATPIDDIPEEELAKLLGVSRLYTATLCRNSLWQSIKFCIDYIQPRYISGKPLSNLSTIQATVGNALLNVYASESCEYFTAGLIDGYVDPDAEVEMAMCRNLIAKNAQEQLLELLAIPGVEKRDECLRQLEQMRMLTLQGESVENVNMFIALTGLHHAGKMLADEVKKIRNPLFNPSFIIKKMVSNRHQEKDDPKLNLYLAEHLHPTLMKPSEQLEYCVLRMRFACETMMARHGTDVTTAYTELNRLAEAATEILAMTAVLARASRSYCIGVRNGELEMKLAACYVENTKDKVKKLIRDISDGEYVNLDHFRVNFGKKVLDTRSALVEKPTVRVFW